MQHTETQRHVPEDRKHISKLFFFLCFLSPYFYVHLYTVFRIRLQSRSRKSQRTWKKKYSKQRTTPKVITRYLNELEISTLYVYMFVFIIIVKMSCFLFFLVSRIIGTLCGSFVDVKAPPGKYFVCVLQLLFLDVLYLFTKLTPCMYIRIK